MARGGKDNREQSGSIISIVGPGTKVSGDVVAEGSIRVEGEIEGTVYAGKAVVVGKEGTVNGDISTNDAVISGQVKGTITAASRLEIHGTATVEGVVRTRRLQLEEGAVLNAEVRMGEVTLEVPGSKGASAAEQPGENQVAPGQDGSGKTEAAPEEGVSAPSEGRGSPQSG